MLLAHNLYLSAQCLTYVRARTRRLCELDFCEWMSQSAVECVVWSEPAVDASPRDARHFHTPRRAVIAGYVLLNHAPTMYIPGGGECAYIASIAVCPHWQRRRIASRLITCAKRLTVRRGSPHMNI